MRRSELQSCFPPGSGSPRESGCRTSCRATTAHGLAHAMGSPPLAGDGQEVSPAACEENRISGERRRAARKTG
jgi:hypothetical protein